MRKITLRELPDWPPEPGGAYESGTVFPVAGEAVVIEVFPAIGDMVTFHGEFGKNPHSYHYTASSETIASRIHAVIFANLGKTVADLGDLEIEIDEIRRANG